MQRLTHSFVVQFAWLRPGALRHIVSAHGQRGQIGDSARQTNGADALTSVRRLPSFGVIYTVRRSGQLANGSLWIGCQKILRKYASFALEASCALSLRTNQICWPGNG